MITYTRPASSVALASSVTLTASAAGSAVDIGDAATLRLDLVITAKAGTNPTLDIDVQSSPDGSTNWVTVASFAQQTNTTAGVHKVFGPCDRYVRINSTIGGTGSPSFTFSVTGQAV